MIEYCCLGLGTKLENNAGSIVETCYGGHINVPHGVLNYN